MTEDNDEIDTFDDDDIYSDTWYKTMDILNKKAKEKKIPISVSCELTPLCNLKCKMCYIRLDKKEMDDIGKLLNADDWIKLLKEMQEVGVFALLMTGGEPTLHPGFVQIYSEAAKLGFIIELYTNAVMLSGEVFSVLKQYPPKVITVTVYGASEEIYEKICGNREAFGMTLKNIRILKESLTNTKINFRTTLVKDNIHEINDIKKIAENMKLPFAYSYGKIKPVRGAVRPEISSCRISLCEIVQMKKDSLKDIKNIKLREKEAKSVAHTEKIINGYNCEINETVKNEPLRCEAAELSCAVTWDGKMLPCLLFSNPYFRPLEIGFKKAWDEIREMEKTITLPKRCSVCKNRPYCGSCPAYAQAESGTYLDGEPYDCFFNK